MFRYALGLNSASLVSSLLQVVGLNFSSATTPELLLKTFDHYCEYRRTPNGVVLAPVQLGKWLVLFCDEINLPDMDKYGTQRVISFIRQVCFCPAVSSSPLHFLFECAPDTLTLLPSPRWWSMGASTVPQTRRG